MAESIAFSVGSDRKTIYAEITPQIEALVSGEPDLVANLANICAVLKEAFGFFWVGFYLKKEDQKKEAFRTSLDDMLDELNKQEEALKALQEKFRKQKKEIRKWLSLMG